MVEDIPAPRSYYSPTWCILPQVTLRAGFVQLVNDTVVVIKSLCSVFVIRSFYGAFSQCAIVRWGACFWGFTWSVYHFSTVYQLLLASVKTCSGVSLACCRCWHLAGDHESGRVGGEPIEAPQRCSFCSGPWYAIVSLSCNAQATPRPPMRMRAPYPWTPPLLLNVNLV